MSIHDVQFPVLGLSRRVGYREYPGPYSSPDMLNCRAIGVFEQRRYGGSRPGLTKWSGDLLGAGNPIRMLHDLPLVSDVGIDYWVDLFNGISLSTLWSQASWRTDIPVVLPGDLVGVDPTVNDAGAVRTTLSTLETTLDYQIALYLVPVNGKFAGEYSIFARMDNTTPDVTTSGVEVELTMIGGDGSYAVDVLVDGVSIGDSSGTIGTLDESGYFEVLISGNDITVFWQKQQIHQELAITAHGTDARFGFGLNTLVSGGISLVDLFKIYYRTGKIKQPRTILTASSNGIFYIEEFPTEMAKRPVAATPLLIGADRFISAVDHLGKLYIADYGDVLAAAEDGTLDGTGLQLDSATYPDWTSDPLETIDPDNHVVVISDALGGAVNGTYEISSVTVDKVILSLTAGTGGTCTFRIEKFAKVYDPLADTLTHWQATSGKGTVPVGHPLMTRYRDRIVMAGGSEAPHNFFASKQGDPLDWNFGALASGDTGSAFAGSLTDAGQIGQHIVALIAHSDDYMIFGCRSSMWLLRGDPAFGGFVDNISDRVGIVHARAWTRGPNDEIVFLSHDGLYAISAGAQNPYPESVSREVMPTELREIDRNRFDVFLEYNPQDRGIHIMLTALESEEVTHFFFDWEEKGFFPETYVSTQEPTSTVYHNGDQPENMRVIFGGRDGFLRNYNNHSNTDDGIVFNSFVLCGPIRTGQNPFFEGMVTQMTIVKRNRSGAVAWEIITGQDNEEAIRNAQNVAYLNKLTGSVPATGGLQKTIHQRLGGGSYVVKLSNGDNTAWALQSVQTNVKEKGLRRIRS